MKQSRREFLKSIGLGCLVPLLPRVPEPEQIPGDPELPPAERWLADNLGESECCSSGVGYINLDPECYQQTTRGLFKLDDPKLDKERLP